MLTEAGKKANGFSLAEAMLAVVILGIAAAGVLLPFTTGAVIRAEGMHRTLGAILTSNLVDRITNTPFDRITVDYDSYTEPQGEIKNFEGAIYSDSIYENFSRAVTCSYVYMPQESGEKEAKFILVTVRVYYNGKQIAIINRLITK